MSIALLRPDYVFKHRLQDDMESIYYVLLLASILYLPRRKVKEFEHNLSSFFDEYLDLGDMNAGGNFKIANVATGLFKRCWKFDNALVQKCLDELIELQRPFQDQPEWTPQALHTILESADEDNLPPGDRMDHRQIIRDKIIEEEAYAVLQYKLAYGSGSSEESVSNLTETTHCAQTPSVTPETSKKRSISEAESEDCGKPVKRPCGAFSAESLSNK